MEFDRVSFLQELGDAIVHYEALPAFPKDLTLVEAYQLLLELVPKVSAAGTAGLKAGVTHPDIQAFLGLTHPLLGMLYKNRQLNAGDVIPFREKSAIECELGIVLDSSGKPISIGPAIEFVYLDFSQPQDMTASNLVVANLGADGFIQGEQIPWQESFADNQVRLFRDGELVMEASMLESFGGPRPALDWMLAEAKARHLSIADNTLLMTGTCGGATPALPGLYEANYGEFGSVKFKVE